MKREEVVRAGVGYVGRGPCGCWSVWIPGATPTAEKVRLVAKLRRRGFDVVSARPEWARENVVECRCGQQGVLDLEMGRAEA